MASQQRVGALRGLESVFVGSFQLLSLSRISPAVDLSEFNVNLSNVHPLHLKKRNSTYAYKDFGKRSFSQSNESKKEYVFSKIELC